MAPEYIEPDDAGFGVVRVTEIPPEGLDATHRAVDACPEHAVSIEDDK